MEKRDDPGMLPKGFDLVDIQRIAGQLWRGRIVIAAMTALSLFLAIAYLHAATYTYTTTLTLIPTQSQQRDFAGQLGGLAAMAGINMPTAATATVSPFMIYPETAQTRQVAANIIQAWPEVMPALFSDQWDAQTRTWHAPQSTRYAILAFLRPLLGIPANNWKAPGPAELQQFIVGSVDISQDKKKSVLLVTLDTPDPDFSRKFTLALHGATDMVLRRMTLDRAKKYAAYLENKLTTAQASAVRDVLTQSLSDQETLLMMSNADTDFAAQPLGPPESSVRPTSPSPAPVLLVGLLLGLLAGGLLVMFLIPLMKNGRCLHKAALDTAS